MTKTKVKKGQVWKPNDERRPGYFFRIVDNIGAYTRVKDSTRGPERLIRTDRLINSNDPRGYSFFWGM